MTINYIVKGFDKKFYNFDAVVVPVVEDNIKGKQGICAFHEHSLNDFSDDFNEIIQELLICTPYRNNNSCSKYVAL